MSGMSRPVVSGLEQLVENETARIRGRRIGLLAHPASVDRNLVHALGLLRRSGADVAMLFGPEHGFSGEAQDMETIVNSMSHPSGIPLKSLYGEREETLAPAVADLRGLDALVVDLQDVGARYYTFVWTALLALRACKAAGIEMILTDRPNPLGGDVVEGAPQTEGFVSFVGLKPIAVRHGMTIGEIVSMAAFEENLSDHLTVIEMSGWRRGMRFEETGLPWVMPSPNMPTLDTALVYPGMCLVEGTHCSEGRGTTRPFELVGLPGIDGQRLAASLNAFSLPGVRFRPVVFKPGFQKHAGHSVGGVQLHVSDANRFLPYRTGIAILLALKSEAGERFAWRDDAYEFVEGIPAIDLLTGGKAVRTMVDDGASLDDIVDTFVEGENAFVTHRAQFLLHP